MKCIFNLRLRRPTKGTEWNKSSELDICIEVKKNIESYGVP